MKSSKAEEQKIFVLVVWPEWTYDAGGRYVTLAKGHREVVDCPGVRAGIAAGAIVEESSRVQELKSSRAEKQATAETPGGRG